MATIREEVVAYVRACDGLLSPFDPSLNQDERDLIAYYVEELARQYQPHLNGGKVSSHEQLNNTCSSVFPRQ